MTLHSQSFIIIIESQCFTRLDYATKTEHDQLEQMLRKFTLVKSQPVKDGLADVGQGEKWQDTEKASLHPRL